MNQPTTAGERILAFLDTAITAREKAAHGTPPGPWSVRLDDDAIIAPDGITVAEAFALSGQQTRAILDLIALNDPQSVLRRCTADRKLIALHQPDGWTCKVCANEEQADEDSEGEYHWSRPGLAFPCPTIVILAKGYGWTEGVL